MNAYRFPRKIALLIPLSFIALVVSLSQIDMVSAAGPGCASNSQGCLHHPVSTGCMQNCNCKYPPLNGDPTGSPPHNHHPTHQRFDKYWIAWDLDTLSFMNQYSWQLLFPAPNWHPGHINAQNSWDATSSNLHLFERATASNADIGTGMWPVCKWKNEGLDAEETFAKTYWARTADSDNSGNIESGTACPDGFPCLWSCYNAVRIRFNGWMIWEDETNCGWEDRDVAVGEGYRPDSCTRMVVGPFGPETQVVPVPSTTRRVALGRIVAHEFGHALGLHGDHRFGSPSCSPNSLMRYTGDCGGLNNNCLTSVEAGALDGMAIRFLYGP